jgi:hypothetical protein
LIFEEYSEYYNLSSSEWEAFLKLGRTLLKRVVRNREAFERHPTWPEIRLTVCWNLETVAREGVENAGNNRDIEYFSILCLQGPESQAMKLHIFAVHQIRQMRRITEEWL